MSNLKAVKLSKAWGSNPKGAVVLVDPQRAAYLTDNGFGKEVRDGWSASVVNIPAGNYATAEELNAAIGKAITKPPVDKMVRQAPKRKGKK